LLKELLELRLVKLQEPLPILQAIERAAKAVLKVKAREGWLELGSILEK
jgi:hypothetical protein